MSEAEFHWLRQCLLGGKLEKVSQGKLRFRMPADYVYVEIGPVVLNPDEQFQAAVRLVFALFAELGTAWAVVKHFRTHKLLFPQRFWGGDRASFVREPVLPAIWWWVLGVKLIFAHCLLIFD